MKHLSTSVIGQNVLKWLLIVGLFVLVGLQDLNPLVALIGLFFIYQTWTVSWKWDRSLGLTLLTFAIIFALLQWLSWTLNPPLTTYDQIKILVRSGFILIFVGRVWSLSLADWFEEVPLSKGQVWRFSGQVVLVLLLAYLPLYLAFAPGNMYIDSYSQWGQASGGIAYNDWHPFFSTALLRLSYLLTRDSRPYLWSQVVLNIIALAYFAKCLVEMNVKRWVIWLALAFFLVGTVTLPNMVTLYKDNIYNSALFIWLLMIFKVGSSQGQWLKGKGYLNSLALLAMMMVVALSRHNGLYVVAASLVLGVLFAKGLRKWCAAFLVAFACLTAFYQGPVMNHYQVTPGPSSEKLSILLQHVGAIAAENQPIEPIDQETLARILPMELWAEKYTPAMADPLKFHSQFKREYLEEHQADFLRTWRHLVTTYPLIAVKAHLQQVRPLWDINGWEHGLAGTIMFHYMIKPTKSLYQAYGQDYTYSLPSLRKQIDQLSFALNPYDRKTRPSLTRAAAYASLSIVAWFIWALVRRKGLTLTLSLPLLLQMGTLFLAMPAYNMRYVLNLIYGAVFLAFVGLWQQKQVQVSRVRGSFGGQTSEPY
ncbi:DUF6020 family protein [Vaginisenegalia massiliensis]|uniref:DUF6020 family protein n=1 Tax=Vaginisenegalia massiliensis TaxID=2058294 RepID=UPI000F544C66|nr:DUF6020 family protein [Vaginisenegalia massiliensis]